MIRRICSLLLCGAAVLVSSCQTPQGIPLLRVEEVLHEPVIRVRVAVREHKASTDGQTIVRIAPTGEPGLAVTGPVHIGMSGATLVIRGPKGDPVLRSAKPIRLSSEDGRPLRIGASGYPGVIVVHPRPDAGGFDIVNHVPIEQYLPGVLDRELYATWRPSTFEAQAIAARSYAIARLARTRSRHYDLESTQASQVYGGTTSNRKALHAVERTRGQLLAYDGFVVPAYYSSCTGGYGQDAAAAFPNGPDMPPLRGRVHGYWGRKSPKFQWGPVARDRGALARRLASWGRAHRHDIANLKRIHNVRVSSRNSVGRVAGFVVVGDEGRIFDIGPESFRHACNYAPAGMALAADQRLFSSHVRVTVAGGRVHFTDGRGYGHGVGMGQFGAQAMAMAGHTAPAILAFYYPGAAIERVYPAEGPGRAGSSVRLSWR
ncbi:MAG: hypothetical protein CMJ18_08195 [Phycisphaeraceae bacterium]|nr:hypothetical protein [Phycisphaeraceae bacterium]